MENDYSNGNGNGNDYENGFNGEKSGNIKDDLRSVSQYKEIPLEKVPMQVSHYFSFEGKNPFMFNWKDQPINWVREEVKVTDDVGKVIYTQQNVLRPDFWSPLAIKIVASKYFWGDMVKGERENSVEMLIGRVSRYIGRQALLQSYFNEKEANVLRDEID